MTITDRYSRAVHSSNLKSGDDTRYIDASMNVTDTDTLGAHAFASKPVMADESFGSPLGVALTRLFVGDNRAVHEVVRVMSRMLVDKGYHSIPSISLSEVQATDVARAVLAWHRHGVCRPCGGLGFLKIEGAPSLSDQTCPVCRGGGKMPFDNHFPLDHLGLARWIREEIEAEQGRAGAAAMRALAVRMQP